MDIDDDAERHLPSLCKMGTKKGDAGELRRTGWPGEKEGEKGMKEDERG